MNMNHPTADIVFKTCLGILPDERVLIVSDPPNLEIATIFLQTAQSYTKHVTYMELAGMTENGQEPPEDIQNALLNTDIALLVTTYSLSHTKARVKATEKGTRIISMPGITKEILLRSVDVDYAKQTLLSESLAAKLTAGSTVTITSPAGTNLTLSIQGRVGEADSGLCDKPHDFINLPAGEAFVAPIEDQANGTLVFDGAIASIDLDKPIILTLHNGVITKVEGGEAANLFEKRMDAVGPKARIICELGIGTNTKAVITPEILEAEKVYGTTHIAFGRNTTFGGTNDVAFHTDGLIKKPTLTIDGTIIMNSGIFV
jgi:leucyl aminopeptidase (aminopeptidase T)